MSHEIDRSYDISQHTQDIRLDVFLSSCSNDLSRSRIQALIKSGDVKVNDRASKAGYRLRAGDRVFLSIPPPSDQPLEPETVEFGIIYEDSSLIVLNKPPGIVSHPAPGHATGTLVHGLLKHCNDLSGIGGMLRPGIVHRLDKDTSGLMVVAKTDRAHAFLAKQFKSGSIKKEYTALVCGRVKGDNGRIDLPIGRHPKKRKEMAVVLSGGRRALTLWEKREEFQMGFSLLSISIKTGRTHQIRVHFSHIGHPVAGDPVYGYRKWWTRHPLYKKRVLPLVNRQMLHSNRLGFIHPDKDRTLKFEAPLPDDMERVVHILRRLDN
ncbi:MAG: RluA family pseudouridine synthase [Desulfobacterales bacterium]|nr:RluA family pseudouridine synthase [Desulfobacterales bacterium]